MNWYDYFEAGSNFPGMRATLGDGIRRLYRLDEPLPDTLVQWLKQLEARAEDCRFLSIADSHSDVIADSCR
jgi:hypothetical protein